MVVFHNNKKKRRKKESYITNRYNDCCDYLFPSNVMYFSSFLFSVFNNNNNRRWDAICSSIPISRSTLAACAEAMDPPAWPTATATATATALSHATNGNLVTNCHHARRRVMEVKWLPAGRPSFSRSFTSFVCKKTIQLFKKSEGREKKSQWPILSRCW